MSALMSHQILVWCAFFCVFFRLLFENRNENVVNSRQLFKSLIICSDLVKSVRKFSTPIQTVVTSQRNSRSSC